MIASPAGSGGHQHGPRWVTLEGAANVRDLGGLPAAGGLQVRPGRVLRADSLHRLTPDDVEVFAELGVRTVIDLRSETEVARLATSPLADQVEIVLVPWRPPLGVAATTGGGLGHATLAEMYGRFVEANADFLATTFTVIADPARLPVVFHCYAGKDRTGITAAILLDTLGVADEAIVADYAATDERRRRFGQLAASETAALGYAAADLTKINPDLTRAPAEQMAAFLVAFRSRWGGGADFLRAAGVTDDQVAALRSHLLEPRA